MVTIFKKIHQFIVNYWLLLLFSIYVMDAGLDLLLDPQLRFVLFVVLIFVFWHCFAPQQSFRFVRPGPLRWYNSVFIWAGIPVVGFVIWFAWLRN